MKFLILMLLTSCSLKVSVDEDKPKIVAKETSDTCETSRQLLYKDTIGTKSRCMAANGTSFDCEYFDECKRLSL